MLQPDNVLCSLSRYIFLHYLPFRTNKDRDSRYLSILPESIFSLYRETKVHLRNEYDQQIHEHHHFSILGTPLKYNFNINYTFSHPPTQYLVRHPRMFFHQREVHL